MKKLKEMFEAPSADVVMFESADVITTSPINPGDHPFKLTFEMF